MTRKRIYRSNKEGKKEYYSVAQSPHSSYPWRSSVERADEFEAKDAIEKAKGLKAKVEDVK